jgi:hypothetical protein
VFSNELQFAAFLWRSSERKLWGNTKSGVYFALKAVADLCVKLACSLLDLLCTLSSGLELKQVNIRFELDLCWYEEDRRTSRALEVIPCFVGSTKVGSPEHACSQKEKDPISRTICIGTSKWIMIRP